MGVRMGLWPARNYKNRLIVQMIMLLGGSNHGSDIVPQS